MDVRMNNQIKAYVKNADQFNCPINGCKHTGRIGCYPKFNKIDEDIENFKIVKSQNELFEE